MPNGLSRRNGRCCLLPCPSVQLRGPLGPRRRYVNTAFGLPGASPPHRAGLSSGRRDAYAATPLPRCHLCQDTNPHKTKRHKNKRSTVKNLNQKICLPGTQTWAKDESEVCLRHLRCLLDDRNLACKAHHQVTNLARGRSQHLLALMS